MAKILLTQDRLDEMVRRIVPAAYQPIGKDNKGVFGSGRPPYITHFSVHPLEKFKHKLAYYYKPEELEKMGRVQAATVNWGLFMLRAGRPKWEDYVKYSYVFFNEEMHDFSSFKLEFVLLHEVGHADWHANYEKLKTLWKKEECELYADLYATEQLAQLYDRDLAQTMLKLFGTEWNRVQKENRYDA